MSGGSSPRSRFVMLKLIMAGKGKKSKQRKKLIKKAKKEERKSNTEVDRSDVKPPSLRSKRS
jgi:hypothetical protein